MNWYDNGGGMMGDSGYAIFGVIFMLIFALVLIWVVIRVIDRGSNSSGHSKNANRHGNSSEALEHLNMRLAKGEIPVEEYKLLKEHLL